MIFEKYLIPDRITERFEDITPSWLKEQGIRAVICDIDNTLATYEQPDPPENVVRWCRELQADGIRIAFVSNNSEERVRRFNQPFGYPAYPNCGKPSGKYLQIAMRAMETDPASTLLLGDQLFTDAAAGKRCGMRTVIVPPICDKKSLFFRMKRLLEKPYLRAYRRRHLK